MHLGVLSLSPPKNVAHGSFRMYGQAPVPELGDVRNVVPKTRADRNAALHREDLEKSRLRARREGYYRHEEAGITQPEGSLGSISDADRFVTDVAAVNKNERDASIAKQEQMYYAKRCALPCAAHG